MSDVSVKICGVRNTETALAAARGGADFLGFVFYRKSPRAVSAETAQEIILELKEASFEEQWEMPKTVGLFVDAGEKELSEAAPFLTHFQFHGHESPERCEELGVEFAVDVIKAIPVGEGGDIAAADAFAEAADMLLFDAAPPAGADRPGGHGEAFDWSVLSAYKGDAPFLLAGGLSSENVAAAIAAAKSCAGFAGVDVSSGVERAPGAKDLEKIGEFLRAAGKS